MYISKLVLPLAGLPAVGQAMADKALRALPGALAPAGPMPSKAGVRHGAPLESVGGRVAKALSAMTSAAVPAAIGNKHRYTHAH